MQGLARNRNGHLNLPFKRFHEGADFHKNPWIVEGLNANALCSLFTNCFLE
jgi:hypothetical protein